MIKEKVLITGGAGFIGSNLCSSLVTNERYDVYSLDNYSTGSKDNHVTGVSYIEGDTSNIRKLIDFSPSIIYHLGEYSRVEQSFDDIEKVWRSNKDGIFSVLEFVRDTGAKLIYSGSSTKFGDDGLGKSQSPYAWTKASNADLVKNYGKWFNIKYAIVYFYNVYGRNEISTGKYATLIALFNEKMRLGQPLTVVSPGTQLRNFTHIDDIINGLLMVGDKGVGDNFGIGCRDSFTVLEIAKMFGGEIQIIQERVGNRMKADVVIEKTELLGWRSEANIKEYIELLRNNNWNTVINSLK